jgi:hypothetical protein
MPAGALKLAPPPGRSMRHWVKVPELSAKVRVFADGSILARAIFKDGTCEPVAEAVEVRQGGPVDDAAVLAAVRSALERHAKAKRGATGRRA